MTTQCSRRHVKHFEVQWLLYIRVNGDWLIYYMLNCISVLKEVIYIRDGRGSCDVFNIDDVLHIINHNMHHLVKIFYHF